MSSAAMLLAPELSVSRLGTTFEDKVHVLWYRGKWIEKKAACGASAVYLLNRGKPDDIDIGNSFSSGDELGRLPQLARLFGGHYLLLWTFGNTMNAVYVRGDPDAREPLILHTGFRLAAFNGQRPAHAFVAFRSWFDDTPFMPNINALQREYQSQRISVVRWMKAFGISGARDLKSVEAAQYWDDLKRVATQLVQGEKAEVQRVKRLNRQLSQLSEGIKLPTQRKKRPGTLADTITSATCGLNELIGKSEDDYWRDISRAAAFYWDISDCEGSCQRLTAGTDKQGLGDSASLGRLMMHYPKPLLRDGVFWSLAALEAEGANGHAYVRGLACLAECCHEAGFTLVVFPSSERQAFRNAFGIHAFEESEPLAPTWSGEVFVDLPGVLTADPLSSAKQWFETTGTSGFCLRGEVDGRWQADTYIDGAACDNGLQQITGRPFDEQRLNEAIRGLDFGRVCEALQLPDLFEPGAWHEGAYGGVVDNVQMMQASRVARDDVLQHLPEPVDERVISDTSVLFPIEDIRRSRDEGIATWVEVNQFWIVLPEANDAYQRELCDDLRGSGLTKREGDVWSEERMVFGRVTDSLSSRNPTMRCLWRGVLGGLPDGTSLRFRLTDIHENTWTLCYRIDRAGQGQRQVADISRDWRDNPRYAEADTDVEPIEDADEITLEVEFGSRFDDGIENETLMTRVLLEGDDRRYFQLDLSSIEPFKAPKLAPLDEQIEALGFTKLGDIYCDAFSGHFLRAYATEQLPHVWVSLMSFTYGDPIVELYTEFADRVSVTTTTNPFVQSREDLGIFYVLCDEGEAVRTELERHCEQVGQLCESGHQTVDCEPTLTGFCQAVERFIGRMG